MHTQRKADPLFGFGQHPKLMFSRWRYLIEERKKGWLAFAFARAGRPISLRELEDSRHPSVTLIPRDQFLSVEDGFGDLTLFEFEHQSIWFSSHDMYIESEDSGVFEALRQTPFLRLHEIPELGFLVPYDPDGSAYLDSIFPHSRADHVWVAAGLAEILLARNGFPADMRAPIVLTVGSHDIAMPIGGDGIKAIDPEFLNEEANFTWVLQRHGLDTLWEKQFGFQIETAARWVKNEGVIGRFLDVVDKLSYVMLDCFWIGIAEDGAVRNYCREHPLFMDVWNDLIFSADKQRFGFTNPERLYEFLIARALEHVELLYNPNSRLIDFCVANLVRPLYQTGKITREQLLTMSKYEFYYELTKHYPARRLNPELIDLNSMGYQRFATHEEADAFADSIHVFHREHVRGFDPCLDWPIADDAACTSTRPLREFLSLDQIRALESLVEQVRGYYVYWRTSPAK